MSSSFNQSEIRSMLETECLDAWGCVSSEQQTATPPPALDAAQLALMDPLARAKALRLHKQQQQQQAAAAASEQQGAEAQAGGRGAAIAEVQRYLSAPTLEESPAFSLLGWWRTAGKAEYPHLARVAAKYLCAQGTSARSEGNFSSLKQTYSALRSRLSEKRVKQCMLLFLNRRLARGIAEIIAVGDGKRVQNLANNRANIEKALGERLAAAAACGESGAAAGLGAGARAESSEVPMPWESEVEAWDGALEAFEG